MEESYLIKVENLSRKFGGNKVVDDISFSLKRGDVLGFLGPNGAGKSTTMKMLSGILAPTSGSVTIDKYDLISCPKEAKKNLGYLSEFPPLYNDHTVENYLFFCAKIKGVMKQIVDQEVARVIDICQLKDVRKRIIGNLSKGYKQRVGIAQAIVHSPKVVILDEPTSGLDPQQVVEMRALINDLKEDKAIIFSTHILAEVQAVCNKIQIINKGKMIYQDFDGIKSNKILSLSFDRTPDIGLIEKLDGVIKVDIEGDNLSVELSEAGNEVQKEIIKMSVNNGWELSEICGQGRHLERLFLDQVCGNETDEKIENKTDIKAAPRAESGEEQ